MYIDGIFSGGGMKGIGLVGAYQVLEEKGYRLKRVAGTSAGAILACFIAAGYNGREMEELMMSPRLPKTLGSTKDSNTIAVYEMVKLVLGFRYLPRKSIGGLVFREIGL